MKKFLLLFIVLVVFFLSGCWGILSKKNLHKNMRSYTSAQFFKEDQNVFESKGRHHTTYLFWDRIDDGFDVRYEQGGKSETFKYSHMARSEKLPNGYYFAVSPRDKGGYAYYLFAFHNKERFSFIKCKPPGQNSDFDHASSEAELITKAKKYIKENRGHTFSLVDRERASQMINKRQYEREKAWREYAQAREAAEKEQQINKEDDRARYVACWNNVIEAKRLMFCQVSNLLGRQEVLCNGKTGLFSNKILKCRTVISGNWDYEGTGSYCCDPETGYYHRDAEVVIDQICK